MEQWNSGTEERSERENAPLWFDMLTTPRKIEGRSHVLLLDYRKVN